MRCHDLSAILTGNGGFSLDTPPRVGVPPPFRLFLLNQISSYIAEYPRNQIDAASTLAVSGHELHSMLSMGIKQF